MLYGGIARLDIFAAVKIETFGCGWLNTVVSFGSVIADFPMSADPIVWRKQQPPSALIVLEVNVNKTHTRSPLKHALPP